MNLCERHISFTKLSGRYDAPSFDITVIKLWTYDVKELLARGFHLLLPFLIVKYRKGKRPRKKESIYVYEKAQFDI